MAAWFADFAESDRSTHVDGVDDTGDAYSQFYGWVLTCQWCLAPPFQAFGQKKQEAIDKMQAHYDSVCGERRVDVRG